MVGEEEERAGGGELLALEQHRRARRQQRQRRQGAEPAGAGQVVQPQAAGRVGDLIVILQEYDEVRRRHAQGGRAAPLLLPLVALALVEVAVLDGRDELLGRPVIIGVIRLVVAGQGDDGRCGGSRRSTGRRGRAALLDRPHDAGRPAARSRRR